jgi:hypothetical protein
MRPIECWYAHPIGLDLVQKVVVVSYTGPQPHIRAYEVSAISETLDRYTFSGSAMPRPGECD